MKIDNPSVTYLHQERTDDHIANCARICYANENSNGSSTRLCEELLRRKHYSMFRHAGVYYIIPFSVGFYFPHQYGSYIDVYRENEFIYVATNQQCAKEALEEYREYMISIDKARHTKQFVEQGMIRLTFACNTQIAIGRELNRKSPNNIAERSTRYVDFIKRIGVVFSKPHWLDTISFYRGALAKLLMFGAQCAYRIARSKYGLNLPAQDARYFLPIGVETKVAYTYSLKEWEYIINVRLWDYTGKAHPDAKQVASLILGEIIKLGYRIKPYE